jgi:hypothetical protein
MRGRFERSGHPGVYDLQGSRHWPVRLSNAWSLVYYPPMSCRPPSLFPRMRRHRGLWVLAVAVLLIKLATSALCLADGPGLQAFTVASGATTTLLNVGPEPTDLAGQDDCILGEGSNCHCACAHTATVPVVALVATAFLTAGVSPPLTLADAVPGAPASLLRPPIA